MHRRIAPLFLAVLIAVPVVVPASAAQPSAPPPAEPSAEPTPPPDPTPGAAPAPTGGFIVMLRSGADTAAVVEKARKRDGVKADRSYARAFRGFSAKLDEKQRRDLLADPHGVAVLPDG